MVMVTVEYAWMARNCFKDRDSFHRRAVDKRWRFSRTESEPLIAGYVDE